MQNRPLSPHITIYKKQANMVSSILHRITGVVLFCFLSAICWGFIAYIFSDFDCDFECCLKYVIFLKIFMYIFSFCFFYHLCTGVRHLLMDLGKGFSLKCINITSIMMIPCAILLSGGFWLLLYTKLDWIG